MAKPQEDLQKAHKRQKNRESFLETLESIIVAFVLAFIFRAFVVEAFVIPTGSMGPTLYGAHAEFKCSDCGYEFAVGADGSGRSEEPAYPPVCPNCSLRQHVASPVRVYSGDRILVLKFLYDFAEPERWDVIVFRNPNDPSQNYIKRLIGLPGETVEITRGDVTVNGRIAPKTDRAQDALWMLVHDTRKKVTRRDWQPRWVPEGGWETRDKGFVLVKVPDRDRIAWLTHRHRNGRNEPDNIRDFYAYNGGSGDPPHGGSVCTDLCLTTEVTAAEVGSTAVIEIRAYKDWFRFELTAVGSEQPSRILVNNRVVAQSKGGVLPPGRSVEVQAANVDRQLMLRVDGRRVMDETAVAGAPAGRVAYDPTPVSAEEREQSDRGGSPDPRKMASEVRVGGRGGPVALAYLRLDRDVYYVNERLSPHNGMSGPGNATEGHPFTLREDEFFVCGDNSPKSFDSRMWTLDRPVVPRNNLVGKAFFVYWPAAGTRYHIPLAPDPRGWRLVH